jgi:protein-S-isoprenylcysteine O-methyltransferase Ste14
MRNLDWPPVWTAAAVVLAWLLGLVLPWPVLGRAGPALGALLAIGGLLLMGLAAGQMMLARTTVIPRQAPRALVTQGVFALSRNPIYLGDLMVVAGALFFFHIPWALPLLAGFVWVIEARFILDEEARLRAAFGPEFEAWAARTARWLNRVPLGKGLLE